MGLVFGERGNEEEEERKSVEMSEEHAVAIVFFGWTKDVVCVC